jgi:hypothetical protein
MRHRWWQAGIAAAALVTASPALASDFSGIGRIFLWGILALGTLIFFPLVVVSRKGRRGSPEGDALIAIIAAVMFAPAIAYRDYSQWVFVPVPGTAVAMLDGRWEVLWPVPLLSIIVSAACAYWLLQRRGTPPGGGSSAA